MSRFHMPLDQSDLLPSEIAITTPVENFRLFFPTLATGTTFTDAFTAPAEQTDATKGFQEQYQSQANGVSVVETGTRNWMSMRFYGSDTNDQTFAARCVAWRFEPALKIWIPRLLCDLACVLGARTLPTTTALLGADTSYFWVDDITVTNDLVLATGTQKLEPAAPDGTPTEIVIDTGGYPMVSIEFTVGTAISANGMYALL